MFKPSLFKSFFMGGFECSTHRRRDGRRLDLLASTKHDRWAAQDYAWLAAHAISTARDGMRWHLIETAPGLYDWSSFLPMLKAADHCGIEVVWDLCHYGWPDDVDVWSPQFVDRFARFAAAAARMVRDESDMPPFFSPVNEISYFAWSGAEVGRFNPAGTGRGGELKAQLVRAAIAAIDAIRDVDPRARIVQIDPVINVVASTTRAADRAAAEDYRNAQFEAWDMMAGFLRPELGGRPDCLDIIGVNYYSDNQWRLGGRTIPPGHALYRPFRELLAETYARYGRPIFVAETGMEGPGRAAWLRYVASEVRTALIGGVPLEGVCLYPVTDYRGWENGRHCECGLLGMADDQGGRIADAPLADELSRQQAILAHLVDRGVSDRVLRAAQ